MSKVPVPTPMKMDVDMPLATPSKAELDMGSLEHRRVAEEAKPLMESNNGASEATIQ
jgi:hypothetical protein